MMNPADFDEENRPELSMKFWGHLRSWDAFDRLLESWELNDEIVEIMSECYAYAVHPDNQLE